MKAYNAYLMEVVTWIAHHHGDTFHPPVECQPGAESSAIVARREELDPCPSQVTHAQC